MLLDHVIRIHQNEYRFSKRRLSLNVETGILGYRSIHFNVTNEIVEKDAKPYVDILNMQMKRQSKIAYLPKYYANDHDDDNELDFDIIHLVRQPSNLESIVVMH